MNFKTFKFISAITYIFFIPYNIVAQSIYAEGGLLFLRNKIEKPLLYGVQTYSQDEYMMIGYEQYLSQVHNTYLSFDYSYYFKGAEFRIRNPYSSDGGKGADIVEAHVFALGYRKAYYLFHNRINASGGVYVKAVKVNRTWPDTYEYDSPYNQSKYFGFYYVRAFPGWRVQPEIRMALDIRFLYRCHFYFDWGITLGFSKWEDIRYEYKYEGKPQPTAVNSVNGTGYFTNIGLKFDIVSHKKREN